MTTVTYQAYDLAGRRKYLNESEGNSFLQIASSFAEADRLLCEALFFLGCRVSEALRLTHDDIETTGSLVRVLCLKKRGKIVTRRIPVPKWLAEALLGLSTDENGRLWPISRSTAWRVIKRAMKLAGISGIQACPKGLRHQFGVRCALAGTPLNVIQQWMGHANPATTGIYLAVQDEEDRALMSKTWARVIVPRNAAIMQAESDGMNVTIKIDEEVSTEARQMAVTSGLSLSGWVIELIQREIGRSRANLQKTLPLPDGIPCAF